MCVGATGPDEATTRSRLAIGVAAAGVLYAGLSLLTWNQIEEDAFIYLRNAALIAEGHGYVFNAGGAPIETSSSLLWLALLTPLHWVPIPIVTATKLLSIALGLLGVGLTAALAVRCVEQADTAAVPPLLLGVSVPFVMWGQRGLETPLYTCLLLSTALCVSSRRYHRYAWIPAAALLFGRPEAPAFAFASLLFLPVIHGRVASIAKQLGLLAAIVAIAEAARFVYFHDLVSQAFYLKIRGSDRAGETLWHFLRESNLLWLAIPLLIVGWRRSFWTRERCFVAGMAALLLGWAARTGDAMPYSRHFVPALPFLFVLVAAAIDAASQNLGRYREAVRASAFALAFCSIALDPSVPYRPLDTHRNPVHDASLAFVREPLRYASALATEMRDAQARTLLDEGVLMPIGHNWQALIGQFIATNYPSDVVVVYDQMGQTPYYAGLKSTFIDSFGLTYRPTGFYRSDQRVANYAMLRSYDSIATRLVGWAFSRERRHFTLAEALDSVFDARPDLILVNRLAAAGNDSITSVIRRDRRMADEFIPRYLLAGWTELYQRRGQRKVDPIVPEGLELSPLGVVRIDASGVQH